MRSNKDYVGEKFNDWEVIDWVMGNKKEVEWICRCKCGKIKQQKVDNIKNGRSKMCKECSAKTRRKKEKIEGEKILKLRYNNHLNWTEENTFIGTYKEFLEECKKKREEFIGQKFGRLTVKKVIKEKGKGTKWLCQCNCGKECIVSSKDVRKGDIKSCGCLKREKQENAISRKRIYRIYIGIIERCCNPNNKNYKNYGGRGIKVCKEWRENARNFIDWAYKNGYNENAKFMECTIDRIDVNGNYEPDNCRWINMKEQSRNTRRNKIIEYNGESKTLIEWSEKLGINYGTLNSRLRNNWSIERAFTKK